MAQNQRRLNYSVGPSKSVPQSKLLKVQPTPKNSSRMSKDKKPQNDEVKGQKHRSKFVEACGQCDDNVVEQYLSDQSEMDHWNSFDKTGKTGLSHACANGFLSIVKLLQQKQSFIDVNLADNEGNSPLIFASQAGHFEIVKLLLNKFTDIRIDDYSNLGFTALMKAAIQGRSKCAKILLYSGASPEKRDFGRNLCAQEWAEYCGRYYCAKTINNFVEICQSGLRISDTILAGQISKNSRLKDTKNSKLSKSFSNVFHKPTLASGQKKVIRCTLSDFCDSNAKLTNGNARGFFSVAKNPKTREIPINFEFSSDEEDEPENSDFSATPDSPTSGSVPAKFWKRLRGRHSSSRSEEEDDDSSSSTPEHRTSPLGTLEDLSKWLYAPALALESNFFRAISAVRQNSSDSAKNCDFSAKYRKSGTSASVRKNRRSLNSKPVGTRSAPGSPTRSASMIVPQLKITLISKDDNYFFETKNLHNFVNRQKPSEKRQQKPRRVLGSSRHRDEG